jgi:hypothetical protein
MTKHVQLAAENLNDFNQITGKVRVSVAVAPGAFAVIAHVHGDDVARIRETL